jgi:hypothetical protein
MLNPLAESSQYAGKYIGRIAVRSSGSFVISTKGTKFDLHYRYCSIIHRADGYSVNQKFSYNPKV